MGLIDDAAVGAFIGMSADLVTTNTDALSAAAASAEASLAGLCGRETFLVREYVRTVRLRPFQTAIILPVRPVTGQPVLQYGPLRRTFTDDEVDTTANTITPHPLSTQFLRGHNLLTGDGPLRLIATVGVVPTPLALATDYYAIRVDDFIVKLATTAANAAAGTAIDITAKTAGRFAIVGPVLDYPLDAVGGIIRFPLPWGTFDAYDYLATVVWSAGLCTSASDAPADLLAWITKQAAFEFREMGPSGRLGNSGQEKLTGVRSQYSQSEWARGVVSGMQRYVLRSVT